MKKILLASILFSGLQLFAMDKAIIQTSVACCFVAVCETARMFVREADWANLPCSTKLDLVDSAAKPFTCCNICTIGAIGCCCAGRPEIGVASSLLGYCKDYNHYRSTMRKNFEPDLKRP